MKKIWLVLLVSLLITSCEKKEESVNDDSAVDVKALAITCTKTRERVTEGAVLIDVRNEEEYALNHLEDAINIPVGEIAKEIGNIVEDKNQVIILYCQSGNRSSQAANVLTDLGYTKIYDLGSINNCEE